MPILIGDVDVSRETMERLKLFESLVVRWSPKINLVSKVDLTDLWQRHILDSAQVFNADLPKSNHWVDLGSGGGFPGIVAAIITTEFAPERWFTLIESDQRKSTFLRTALRECGVTGQVIADRIQSAAPQSANILSARALAPVTDLLAHAVRHMNENGVALLHKGRNYAQELDAAKRVWSFDVTTHQSLTAPDSCILAIRNIRRADAQ
ncbi:16S rRNA (guanine(527)-N(7))-methyltransferase RsmG [Yoonia sp. R2331]|uniref:16S rRNA (guanine(527)-N(7))-methyltransferase RsmG n=1 Tax=Yoonia sp. R2331 TaxID=3237238 RepID=UPI0034E3F872